MDLPQFAVTVSGWVHDLLTKGRAELALPTTGDALLDSIQATHRLAGALIEVRQHQIATDRELVKVWTIAEGADAKAETAVVTATAALRAIESGQGYSTVAGYARRVGLQLSLNEVQAHGRNLADLCRKAGIQVRQVEDTRWGTVNSYPDGVLADYFDQVLGAADR
jgi:hypothetical protein